MTFKISRALALVSSGAVIATGLAGLASAPAAAADPRGVEVDIVGDSYSAGEGMIGHYFNANDPRHRSPYAA
ncbi:hypothetical protein ACWEKM_24890, partial [Streptomyces sp. NPDC004752]